MATKDKNNKSTRHISDEEFEQMWQQAKARDTRLEAEYNALPENEKKRLKKKFSDPFYERISENPMGDDETDEN